MCLQPDLSPDLCCWRRQGMVIMRRRVARRLRHLSL
jgi:hypothetical protein